MKLHEILNRMHDNTPIRIRLCDLHKPINEQMEDVGIFNRREVPMMYASYEVGAICCEMQDDYPTLRVAIYDEHQLLGRD